MTRVDHGNTVTRLMSSHLLLSGCSRFKSHGYSYNKRILERM